MIEAELCAAVSRGVDRARLLRLHDPAQPPATADGDSGHCRRAVRLHGTALVAVDKLDKIRIEGVPKELVERGISGEAAQNLATTITATSLDAMVESLGGASPSIENLRQILRLVSHTSESDRMRFDPTLARGLSYYTGAIMEINVPTSPAAWAAADATTTWSACFSARAFRPAGSRSVSNAFWW